MIGAIIAGAILIVITAGTAAPAVVGAAAAAVGITASTTTIAVGAGAAAAAAGGIAYGVVSGTPGSGGTANTALLANIFSERRRIKYGRMYACSKVQVLSSGNELVDRVRAGLSFNDIQATSLCGNASILLN